MKIISFLLCYGNYFLNFFLKKDICNLCDLYKSQAVCLTNMAWTAFTVTVGDSQGSASNVKTIR